MERTKVDDIECLTPARVYEALRWGRIVVVDVRSADEVLATGLIPGAWSIPLRQLYTRAAELLEPRGIVTVCDDGRRAKTAAMTLRMLGFGQVWALAGGMKRWVAVGYPVQHALG